MTKDELKFFKATFAELESAVKNEDKTKINLLLDSCRAYIETIDKQHSEDLSADEFLNVNKEHVFLIDNKFIIGLTKENISDYPKMLDITSRLDESDIKLALACGAKTLVAESNKSIKEAFKEKIREYAVLDNDFELEV